MNSRAQTHTHTHVPCSQCTHFRPQIRLFPYVYQKHSSHPTHCRLHLYSVHLCLVPSCPATTCTPRAARHRHTQMFSHTFKHSHTHTRTAREFSQTHESPGSWSERQSDTHILVRTHRHTHAGRLAGRQVGMHTHTHTHTHSDKRTPTSA